MKKFLALFLLAFFGFVHAYSVLGIRQPFGEAIEPVTGQSRGMGGVSVALVNPKNMSLVNIANLSVISVPSFSILYVQQYTTVNDGTQKNTLTDTDIPMAVFVYPFTNIGNLIFSFEQKAKLAADFLFDQESFPMNPPVYYTQKAVWSGSLYSGGVGFARQWLPSLCAGFAYKRYFGYEKSNFQIDFLDTLNASYADRFDTTAFNSQTDYLSLGLTIKRKLSRLGMSMTFPVYDQSEMRQTLAIAQKGHFPVLYNSSGSIHETMPLSFSVGFSSQIAENWLLAADGSSTLWKAFKRDGYNQNLGNEIFVAFGTEWVFNSLNSISGIPSLPLRAGTFYRKWAAENTQELGLSMGSGLSLGKGSGAFDFSLEYSRRGDLATVGLKEDCFRFSISLTGGSLTNKTKR